MKYYVMLNKLVNFGTQEQINQDNNGLKTIVHNLHF